MQIRRSYVNVWKLFSGKAGEQDQWQTFHNFNDRLWFYKVRRIDASQSLKFKNWGSFRPGTSWSWADGSFIWFYRLFYNVTCWPSTWCSLNLNFKIWKCSKSLVIAGKLPSRFVIFSRKVPQWLVICAIWKNTPTIRILDRLIPYLSCIFPCTPQ